MNLFVTGGTGFIGSHFVRTALRARHRVVAIRRSGSMPRIQLTEEPAWIDKELFDCEPHNLQGIDALVHFASAGVSPQKASWEEMFNFNVNGTLHIMQVAKTAGVPRIVIAGSCAEYGNSAARLELIPTNTSLEPTSGYSASKAAAFIATRAFSIENSLELCYLRIFQAYGEGQYERNFWPQLRRAALAGEDFPMTKGEQVRDFIAVEDVAARFLDVAANSNLKPGNPEIHNIGSGKPQTLRAFAEHWWEKWEAKGKLLYGAIPYRENEVMRYVPQLTL